jgi:hypothetical protein
MYESFTLLVLYGVYITIMNYNIELKNYVQQQWTNFGKKSSDELENLKASSGAVQYHSFRGKVKKQIFFRLQNDEVVADVLFYNMNIFEYVIST